MTMCKYHLLSEQDLQTSECIISQKLFDTLFEDGIYLVTGLRSNMKNRLMPFYDKIMLILVFFGW